MKFIDIKGDSMSPILNPKEIIVTRTFLPVKARPNQIVIYEFMEKLLIKRLVGLPGINLKIEDHLVYGDGKPVFRYHDMYDGISQYYELKIPENNVFVLGENPNNSLDSRKIGTIPINTIKYYGIARIWPPKLL